MSGTLRIRRRVSGNAGAPTSLQNAELAFNEPGNVLYYGVGVGGAGGSATAIIPIGGSGAFADLTTAQIITGVKTYTVSPQVPTAASTDSSLNAASTAFVTGYIGSIKAQPNGLASLGSDGTLTAAQIPMILKGAMKYMGTWDASANTPTLTSGQGTQGAVYKVTKTGTTTLDGHSTWNVGDSAVFNGATWDKWDGTDVEVLSVNGQTGTVVLATDQVAEGVTNLYFTAARVLAALLTGLSTTTATAITASDSVIGAFGKLQGQVSARLISANNLSDLNNPATARTNLGLGTIAVQSAANVQITGGTIDNVTLDGGTF